MGFKDIWNCLFGREAEIDFSKVIPTAKLTRVTRNCSATAVVKVHRHDTDEVITLKPGEKAETPNNVELTVTSETPPLKSFVRSRKPTAHGKVSRKAKASKPKRAPAHKSKSRKKRG